MLSQNQTNRATRLLEIREKQDVELHLLQVVIAAENLTKVMQREDLIEEVRNRVGYSGIYTDYTKPRAPYSAPPKFYLQSTLSRSSKEKEV